MRALLEILERLSDVTFVTGFLLNFLLLYLIRNFSTKDLGTYKYLLEIFAAYDTYLVAIHHITNPKTIPSHTGFAYISDRDYGTFLLEAFYSSVYSVPFMLLNIHLLYRFWTIRAPHRIILFSNIKFVTLLVVTTMLAHLFMFSMSFICARPEDDDEIAHYRSLFRQEYGRDRDGGYFIMNYWRDDQLNIPPFTLLVFADIVQGISFCLASTLATLTFREIRRARHISETIRTFHFRILLAASAQTLTPVIFVYIPFFLNVNISLVHIYSPTFSALGMVLLSSFPCLDAVVIIVLMKPYRDGLLKLLGKKGKKKSVKILTAFTTSVHVINTIQIICDKPSP